MSEAAAPQLERAHLAGASLDARLQASRRIDWRFLMPDPELGDVALVGSPDPALRAALELFAHRLVERPGGPVAGEAFDLLVVIDPGQGSWSAWLDAVRPGGHAYLELGRRRLGRSPGVAHPVRELEAHGYEDIERHWHWPSFEQHSALLDLDAPAALGHFLRRKWPGWRGRVLATIGAALSPLGGVDRIARHCSVLGRRCPR